MCGKDWRKERQNMIFPRKEQFKAVLSKEWNGIKYLSTETLVESMPKRIKIVISAKEYSTVY